MQNVLMFAIAGLVALASFCFVWFGAGLVMKLQQGVKARPKQEKSLADIDPNAH